MNAVKTLLAVLAMTFAAHALAVEPGEMLPDPVLEQRAREISTHLRCVVCQNQTIDDSDAPLAHDMRLLVRERLTAGDTDGEVLDYIVARYGNFVLLRPPFQANTWVLWIAPFAVLALALAGLLMQMRGRAAPSSAPLTEEERALLQQRLAPKKERV
ncbi:MAG: cytochrome c-type biogenesis protein [Terricaulis sp.]